MKKITILICMIGLVTQASAQVEKLSGPRMGVTMVTPGILASVIRGDVGLFDSDELSEEWQGNAGQYGAAMFQYGWQFESRFADGGDIVGIVEWIALVGGMEKGFFLPSLSSMVGLRTGKGFEIAMGPNLSLSGVSMVFGCGYNFKVGKLNLPINIACVPSITRKYDNGGSWDYNEETGEQFYIQPYTVEKETGHRVTITAGFNIGK